MRGGEGRLAAVGQEANKMVLKSCVCDLCVMCDVCDVCVMCDVVMCVMCV